MSISQNFCPKSMRNKEKNQDSIITFLLILYLFVYLTFPKTGYSFTRKFFEGSLIYIYRMRSFLKNLIY